MHEHADEQRQRGGQTRSLTRARLADSFLAACRLRPRTPVLDAVLLPSIPPEVRLTRQLTALLRAMIAPVRRDEGNCVPHKGDSGACLRLQIDESKPAVPSVKGVKHSAKTTKTESATFDKAPTGWRSPRTYALGLIALAALNLSLMRVCVKFASRQVTSNEAVLWRSGVAWMLNLVLVYRRRVSVFVEHKRRGVLFWRCLAGTFGISIQFYAMSQMVLTDAVVIIFTSPIVTFLLGALVLGEAIDRLDFLSCLVSYVGVMFVTRPAFLFGASEGDKQGAPPLAIACALGGAVMQACSYIAMRQLRDVNYVVINHYFLLFGLGYALLTLWYFGVSVTMPGNVPLLLALLGSGVFAFAGQVFLTMGFQQSKAGIASVMRYLDVVFVLIWDVALLGEHVSAFSVLGAAIIIASASFIVLPRARRTAASDKGSSKPKTAE